MTEHARPQSALDIWVAEALCSKRTLLPGHAALTPSRDAAPHIEIKAHSPAPHLELRHELAAGAEGNGFTSSLGPRQVVAASVLEGGARWRDIMPLTCLSPEPSPACLKYTLPEVYLPKRRTLPGLTLNPHA